MMERHGELWKPSTPGSPSLDTGKGPACKWVHFHGAPRFTITDDAFHR